MFHKKFKYDDYEKLLEQQKYEDAQKYCASFLNDKNAKVCGWYAQYFLLNSNIDTDISFLDLDNAIKSVYGDIMSRGQSLYNEKALYLLGMLLFERSFDAEGDNILISVAALNKKREKLSETEKNVRVYLELLYFQKWENNHQVKDLKKAADCFGHSEVCYLYAEKLREKGCEQDEADWYEFIGAVDYCAVWMDKDTYHRKCNENYHNQISNDIRKDIGIIASGMSTVQKGFVDITNHLKTMEEKIDGLSETICDKLHREFDVFRTKTSKLLEQMVDREEIVCSLIEKAQILDLEQKSNQDVMQELKALAEQIREADRKSEAHFKKITDELKNVVLDKNNQPLQEIVKEAEAEIDSRFHKRLSPEARESIVTALFTLSFYKKFNKEQEVRIEYSGVVILATSALEIELYNRVYNPYKKYLQEEYGQELDNFTLMSIIFVTGIWGKEGEEREQKYNRFSKFIQKNRNKFLDNSDSLFHRNKNDVLQRGLLNKFAKRLDRLSKARNNAAHRMSVHWDEAKKVCESVFLSPEYANKVTNESISLLEWLLKSCALEEDKNHQ